MCRPIESRDSLGAVSSAAAAVFAGYQPPGNVKALPMAGNQQANLGLSLMGGPPSLLMRGEAPPATTAYTYTGGLDALDMMSMAGLPPPVPFVSFEMTPSPMSLPWLKAPSEYDIHQPPMFLPETKRRMASSAPHFQEPDGMDSADLEDLLDFSLPENSDQDKQDLVNMDDGFDGTEMSILYSFLADAPADKATTETQPLEATVDDGILKLDLMSKTPIDSFMESLQDDFTDEDVRMSPPPSNDGAEVLQSKDAVPEVKSRRLCRVEACYKRSRSNGMCISHGGGRRCAIDGCNKSSQGGNLCIRHGGGKRCSIEGCDKAAQSNFLCKAHGGGPRCQIDDCHRSSQGGGFCRSHGGGKRCNFDGCRKGTQRGAYCALHGGSRLCAVPGCMRNDRGGGLCATHGGGKRCMIDGCSKPCRRKSLCSAHLRQEENST